MLASPKQAKRLIPKATKSLNSPYPEISLADLQDEKFVLQALPAAGRLHVDMAFKSENFSPKIAAESDSLDVVYALASSGMGLAFITDALIPVISPKYGAVFFTLKFQSPFITKYAFTYRTNSYLSKATLAFFEVIKEVYGD